MFGSEKRKGEEGRGIVDFGLSQNVFVANTCGTSSSSLFSKS